MAGKQWIRGLVGVWLPKHARGALRLPGMLAVAIALVGLGGCGVVDPKTKHRVIGFIDFDDEHLAPPGGP